MYNDIVTTIGRGNGAMLVLLDVSAAFDAIDHDNLFMEISHIFLIVLNVFKLMMFCQILLLLFVVFHRDRF